MSNIALSDIVLRQLKHLEDITLDDKSLINECENSKYLDNLGVSIHDIEADVKSAKINLSYSTNTLENENRKLSVIVKKNKNLENTNSTYSGCNSKSSAVELPTPDCFNINYKKIQNILLIPDIPKSVRKLNLSHNELNEIPYNFFSPYEQMSFLDLSYNKIHQINFFLPAELHYLNISYNPVKTFTILPYLRKLNTLILTNTNLESLSELEIIGDLFLNLEQIWIKKKPFVLADHNLIDFQSYYVLDGEIKKRKLSPTFLNNYIKSEIHSADIYHYEHFDNSDVIRRKQQENKSSLPSQTILSHLDIQNFINTIKIMENQLSEKDHVLNETLNISTQGIQINHKLENELNEAKLQIFELQAKLEKAEKLNKDNCEKLIVWQKKTADLSSSLMLLKSQLLTLNIENQGVKLLHQQDIENITNSYIEKENKINTYCEEMINKYREEIDVLKEQNNFLQRSLNEKQRGFTDKINQSEDQLCYFKTEIENLNRNNLRLVEENKNFSNKEIEWIEHKKKINTELLTLKKKLSNLEEEKLEIIKKFEINNKELLKNEVQIKNLQNEISDLSNDWISHKKYASLQNDFEKKDHEMNLLNDKYCKLSEYHTQMTSELKEVKEDLHRIKIKNTEAIANIKLKNEQLRENTNELCTLKKKYENIFAENNTLKKEIELMESTHKNVEKSYTLLKEELLITKKKLDSTHINAALTNQKKINQELENKILNLEKEKKNKESTFEYLQEALNQLQIEIESQKLHVQNEIDKNDKFRREEYSKERESLLNNLKSFEDNIHSKIKEIETLKNNIQDLEKIMNERDEEIRILLLHIDKLEITKNHQTQCIGNFIKSIHLK